MRSVLFRYVLVAGLLTLSCHNIFSQSFDGALPRRGFFGVALTNEGDGKVGVSRVVDNSTAAAVGIMPGDIITHIDANPISTMRDVTDLIGSRTPGVELTIHVLRKDQHLQLTGAVQPYPLETFENASLQNGHVIVDKARLRTILSIPNGAQEKYPAVMYLQGGGCGSIECYPRHRFINAFGSQGFVTLRVEKSGVGDSEGPACADIGYREELAGYQAGIDALKQHPQVDGDKVFLFGGSLGGVFAPILASTNSVAGIAAYGTLAGPPPPYPGRSDLFFEEFKVIDVLKAWTQVNAPVLIMHGEYDDRTTAADHALIAATVNKVYPGTAMHREILKLDHCHTRHPSLEASVDNCGGGERSNAVSDAALSFFKSHS